jgi:hypothetical protein
LLCAAGATTSTAIAAKTTINVTRCNTVSSFL